MKKTLLLAGVACLFAANVNARMHGNGDHNMMWYGKEVAPYIGVDYAYDHANYKQEAKGMKKSYNSAIFNMGVRTLRYMGLEAFFQQSANNKSYKHTENPIKTRFYAFGADAYGYMPIGCDGFNLLGSLGLANYNIKAKYALGGSNDKNRMGYRAGLGMQYDFTQHIAARVMGRYNYIGAKHLDNLKEVTVGMRYSF